MEFNKMIDFNSPISVSITDEMVDILAVEILSRGINSSLLVGDDESAKDLTKALRYYTRLQQFDDIIKQIIEYHNRPEFENILKGEVE
jgi:hypothetical protein